MHNERVNEMKCAYLSLLVCVFLAFVLPILGVFEQEDICFGQFKVSTNTMEGISGWIQMQRCNLILACGSLKQKDYAISLVYRCNMHG